MLLRRTAFCLATGFSSGLPLYVGLQLLPAWLQDRGVDLPTIGLFALTGLPYTWKVLWAPLLDRFAPVPGWGRRRAWAAVAQVGLAASLASLARLDPATHLQAVAVVAFVVAALSATQDVALDAWRRELLPDAELGWGNSVFVNAYRLASLVPGSLALILADHLPWATVHLVVACFMAVGLVATWVAPEPGVAPGAPTLRQVVVEPFTELWGRVGGRRLAEVLALLVLYKLGDAFAATLLTPFLLDLGYSRTELGTVVKVASLTCTVGGGLLGGLCMLRLGVVRSLWWFGWFQLASTLGYAALALSPLGVPQLFVAVAIEHLGVGLGTAAFVAFVAQTTSPRHAATQLALLTALAGVPRTLVASLAGVVAQALGWAPFFALCTALALPGMWLTWRVYSTHREGP